MLSYQQNFFDQTQELTAEQFTRFTLSDQVVKTIAEVRNLLEKADSAQELIDARPDAATLMSVRMEEDRKRLLNEAAKLKRSLPKIIWQATFDETPSKKGYVGRWRKQAACRLNGLFMIDLDHINDPRHLFMTWVAHDDKMYNAGTREEFCNALGIMLVHITPSGKGLRLVAKADPARGNISDNQHWLADQLLVMIDESCKDATRLSFCCGFEDILYINNEIFTYENKEFDEKYGAQYRGGSSRPTAPAAPGAADAGGAAAAGAGPAGTNTKKTVPPAVPGAAQGGGNSGQDSGLEEKLKEGYHGKSYKDICQCWFDTILHGTPQAGDRHQSLFRMACDLRYICDHDPKLLARVLAQCDVGAAVCAERGMDEIVRIATDACARQRWATLPKRIRTVLAAAGLLSDGENVGEESEGASALDYDAYGQRLDVLLRDSPGLREAVEDLPLRLKLGGVLAAGAMLGTYLTRCWWEHFDGKIYRLSYLVYIVGQAASGKSFITQLDKLLMAPILVADRIGREAEKQYKEKQKTRKANEQLPETPHPVIRYCPSTTSNAILYRRLQDAIDPNIIDPETDEPMHLHLITVESELATALRSQVGSWAGKSDLELKSFHNEKAGVDFANSESTNGIMQINWNQVISGTKESLSRKIKPANVLDGLVTRLAMFPMPDNDFQMLERKQVVRNHERDCKLRMLGYELEKVAGELHVPRLVDFCYEYEAELTRLASLEQDVCLDYFRKRIPVIMIRYTLVRMVLRQLEAAKKGEDLIVEDSDLEFARLIGDWCLQAQIAMFGQMVTEALENERQTFAPVSVYGRTRSHFNELPNEFAIDQLVEKGVAKNLKTAQIKLARWEKLGLVKQIKEKIYKKVFEKI